MSEYVTSIILEISNNIKFKKCMKKIQELRGQQMRALSF